MATVEDLIAGSAGRGAWVGLMPRDMPDVGAYRPEHPHVTLAHLGRGIIARAIRDAATACAVAAERLAAPTAKLDGTAVLEQVAGRAAVLLLRDDQLLTWHRELCETLHSLGVGWDRKFPFRAHITMAKMRATDEAAVPKRVDPRTILWFDKLILVVGDNRIEWQLRVPL